MNYVKVTAEVEFLVPVNADTEDLAVIEAGYKLDQGLNIKQEISFMCCQGKETLSPIMELDAKLVEFVEAQ